MNTEYHLDRLSTHQLSTLLNSNESTVLLLPLGSTEPHGPHLPLRTDVVLAEETAIRAAKVFPSDYVALVAPTLPYGVTDFAAGFKGAIGLSESTFANVLSEIISGFLDDGFDHVSLINHHLDPGHLKVIQSVMERLTALYGARKLSHPSVLERRWGRQLGEEFKSGACHAGRYEGSMLLAAEPQLFQNAKANALPKLNLSLSQGISEGITTFKELGMADAYTGDPSKASTAFGHDLYNVMCDMVITTVMERMRSLG